MNDSTDTRFANLDLNDSPRRDDANECPRCGDELGATVGCEVCATERHRQARELANAEEAVAEWDAAAAETTQPITTAEVQAQVDARLAAVAAHDDAVAVTALATTAAADSGSSRIHDDLARIQAEGRRLAATGRASIGYTAAAQFNRSPAYTGAASAIVGVFISWSGRGAGELTQGQIRSALRNAGMATELAPNPKRPRAHLEAAMNIVRHYGLVPRNDRKGTAACPFDGELATTWVAGRPDFHGENVKPGQPFGRYVMTCWLMKDGALHFEGDPEMCGKVHAEYTRLSDRDAHLPGDVTAWLTGDQVRAGLLQRSLGACAAGANWFIPNAHADKARALINALIDQGWNPSTCPAMPVAAYPELQRTLAGSLVAEVAAIQRAMDKDRSKAKAQGKADIGHKAANTVRNRLASVRARLAAHRPVVGDEMATTVERALDNLGRSLENVAGDATEIRGALIWEELARDLHRP